MKNKIYTLFIAAIGFSLLLISGCNTMEGAGKDIKKAGNKLEDSANKNKNY